MKHIARSLAGRLILGSALLLPLFLGASGWYLERSHRASLEAGEAERLRLQVLALLAQADYGDTHDNDNNNVNDNDIDDSDANAGDDRDSRVSDGAGISLPKQLLEPRYHQPNSGLYARITGADGATLWVSPSTVSLPTTLLDRPPPALPAGERHFERRDRLYILSWQVLWETSGGRAAPLQFTVMESAEPIDADLHVYRRHLLLWLGGSALLLLACQGAVLGWALTPLRRLAAEVAAIEAGGAEHLTGDYPREVQPLTSNLNALLDSERNRRERVRNTLADLAHSLKSPLAVLRSADQTDAGFAAVVREQTARMEQIVNYQLQRSAGGALTVLQRLPLLPLAQRLRETLMKVHAAQSPVIALAIEPHCQFRGDERDLLEILGNLMDNACKYGGGTVRVSAEGSAPGPLTLTVEDNGPGIPANERERILQRGARLDERGSGQGLGLAVAADIVANYRGSIEIDTGALGGARVVIRFP